MPVGHRVDLPHSHGSLSLLGCGSHGVRCLGGACSTLAAVCLSTPRGGFCLEQGRAGLPRLVLCWAQGASCLSLRSSGDLRHPPATSSVVFVDGQVSVQSSVAVSGLCVLPKQFQGQEDAFLFLLEAFYGSGFCVWVCYSSWPQGTLTGGRVLSAQVTLQSQSCSRLCALWWESLILEQVAGVALLS